MSDFYHRSIFIGAIICLVGVIFIIQLANLQLIDDTYIQKGIKISHLEVVKGAPRGLIFDRNGKLLVNNTSRFSLSVIPRIASKHGFDTLLLSKLLEIPKEELCERLLKASNESKYYYKYSKLYGDISPSIYAKIKEYIYKLPGFAIERSEGRSYNYTSLAHTMGYVKEISDKELKRDDYYLLGDYIGKSGIEKTYEKELRGEKGSAFFLRDHKQKIVGRYDDGRKDIPTVPGKSLTMSIDINLQEYASLLMKNKRGAIIAIEPSTGEILAKVSAPSYNLDSLYGKNSGNYYQTLIRDELNKPLFDRTVMAQYPPGSIFKLLNALVALEEGVITRYYNKNCFQGGYIGSFFMRCHYHHSPVSLMASIQHSCNPYYAHLFRDLLHSNKYQSVQDGYNRWRKYMTSFGLGQKLGGDFTNQKEGNIPTVEYYSEQLKRKHWVALNIISLSIGQGELMITPLQMVNMTATIANRGWYYIPHIVKKIGNSDKKKEYLEKHIVDISKKNFNLIIKGMKRVVNSGTGEGAKTPNIDIAGKTGTVQVSGGKEDNSVFVAFAPIDNPKIALIVYVENAGWGSECAAPMAGLVIEKYIKGDISPSKKKLEEFIIKSNFIKNNKTAN